ncbi:hypothetical protein ACOMHN_029520 [Nucella lapillus]
MENGDLDICEAREDHWKHNNQDIGMENGDLDICEAREDHWKHCTNKQRRRHSLLTISNETDTGAESACAQVRVSLRGTFTIQFKREFILCCYCLQNHWRKRRGTGSHVGKHRTALLYTQRSNPRNSESSGSSRAERLTRSLSPREGEVPSALHYQSAAPSPYACRLSQLPAAGGYTLGVFLSGSGYGGGSDVSTECSRMSLNSIGREQLFPDRANINNFVRVCSSEY